MTLLRKGALITAFYFLSLLGVLAQSGLPVGGWRTYLSHNFDRRMAEKNGVLYNITQGGMFTYEISTGETVTYSTIEGLSGISPNTIYHDEGTGEIFIGYTDGMIDYFSSPEQLSYLSDIFRNDFFTQKSIRQFTSDENRLYVATDFGIVVYDLRSKLTVFTITQIGENASKLPVESVAIFEGRIWAAMGEDGTYSAPQNAINLTDPAVWRREDGVNGLPITELREVTATPDRLFGRHDTTVYVFDAGQWSIFTPLARKMAFVDYHRGQLIGGFNSAVTLVNPDDTWDIYYFTVGTRHAYFIDNVMYVANAFQGLLRDQFGDGQPYEPVTPSGPTNNNVTRVAAGNGEFYVAPRGYDGSYNPVGDPFGVYYHNPEIGWKILSKDNGGLDPLRANDKFARALYDPNTRTAYMGSWGRGMSKIVNGTLEEYYDCDNSGLSWVNGASCNLSDPVATRVSGMGLDAFGTMWVSQSFAQRPLAAMTSDGTWYNFPGTLFPGANFINLLVDDYGNKWLMNRLNGLFVFNDQGTLDNPNDDVVVKLTTGLNQGDLPSNNVISFAKDHDGFIWVGTDVGVTVFFDPFSISRGSRVDASCPVFERRCLLKDETINGIAVDGGNRKWFATNNGVFLVSPDGDEVIENFTIDNSPLLSNTVFDVSIDGSTGEVFFATQSGLISYQGDATDGGADCSEVLIFPNPVYNDFTGKITIRGSAAESKVKITTVSGRLVRELDAQGGTAVWDGLDYYGNRVASGVYLALIANKDGEKACVGKFAVINR